MKWIHNAGRCGLAVGLASALAACGGARSGNVDLSQPCSNYVGATQISDTEVQTAQGERVKCLSSAKYFDSRPRTAASPSGTAGSNVEATVPPGAYNQDIYLSPEAGKTCAQTYKNGEYGISTPAGLYCVSASFFQNSNTIPRPRFYGFQMCTHNAPDCSCRPLNSMNMAEAASAPGLQGHPSAGFCF